MPTLFMVNVPHNCNETELSDWVNASGISVKSVRMIRDTVAGVSPSFAYVELLECEGAADAVARLNGQCIRERVIMVSEARRSRTAA